MTWGVGGNVRASDRRRFDELTCKHDDRANAILRKASSAATEAYLRSGTPGETMRKIQDARVLKCEEHVRRGVNPPPPPPRVGRAPKKKPRSPSTSSARSRVPTPTEMMTAFARLGVGGGTADVAHRNSASLLHEDSSGDAATARTIKRLERMVATHGDNPAARKLLGELRVHQNVNGSPPPRPQSVGAGARRPVPSSSAAARPSPSSRSASAGSPAAAASKASPGARRQRNPPRPPPQDAWGEPSSSALQATTTFSKKTRTAASSTDTAVRRERRVDAFNIGGRGGDGGHAAAAGGGMQSSKPPRPNSATRAAVAATTTARHPPALTPAPATTPSGPATLVVSIEESGTCSQLAQRQAAGDAEVGLIAGVDVVEPETVQEWGDGLGEDDNEDEGTSSYEDEDEDEGEPGGGRVRSLRGWVIDAHAEDDWIKLEEAAEERRVLDEPGGVDARLRTVYHLGQHEGSYTHAAPAQFAYGPLHSRDVYAPEGESALTPGTTTAGEGARAGGAPPHAGKKSTATGASHGMLGRPPRPCSSRPISATSTGSAKAATMATTATTSTMAATTTMEATTTPMMTTAREREREISALDAATTTGQPTTTVEAPSGLAVAVPVPSPSPSPSSYPSPSSQQATSSAPEPASEVSARAAAAARGGGGGAAAASSEGIKCRIMFEHIANDLKRIQSEAADLALMRGGSRPGGGYHSGGGGGSGGGEGGGGGGGRDLRGAAGVRRLLAVLHGRCLADPAALGGIRSALEAMGGPGERGLVVAGMAAAGAGDFAGFLSAEMPDLDLSGADLDATKHLLHGLSYSLEEGPARERELEKEEERQRQRDRDQERELAWSLPRDASRNSASPVDDNDDDGDDDDAAVHEYRAPSTVEEENSEEKDDHREEEEDDGEEAGDGEEVGDESEEEQSGDELKGEGDEGSAADELSDASSDEYGDQLGYSSRARVLQPALGRDPNVIDPDYLDDDDDDDDEDY